MIKTDTTNVEEQYILTQSAGAGRIYRQITARSCERSNARIRLDQHVNKTLRRFGNTVERLDAVEPRAPARWPRINNTNDAY